MSRGHTFVNTVTDIPSPTELTIYSDGPAEGLSWLNDIVCFALYRGGGLGETKWVHCLEDGRRGTE